jgi:predicted esterase
MITILGSTETRGNNNYGSEYDPIVPPEQTKMLFRLFKDAGANVILYWQKNSGHELGYDENSAAKDWLSDLS